VPQEKRPYVLVMLAEWACDTTRKGNERNAASSATSAGLGDGGRNGIRSSLMRVSRGRSRHCRGRPQLGGRKSTGRREEIEGAAAARRLRESSGPECIASV
jgi:hypothetical protein